VQSTSYRFLKGASVLVFIIAIFIFVASQIITFAGHYVSVRNSEGQIIGKAWIPHDYSRDQEIYGMFVVLSGLQTWATFAIGKEKK
jgi:hypothetical protein